jgi:hypothetical protein
VNDHRLILPLFQQPFFESDSLCGLKIKTQLKFGPQNAGYLSRHYYNLSYDELGYWTRFRIPAMLLLESCA